jgi:hypothetical protein
MVDGLFTTPPEILNPTRRLINHQIALHQLLNTLRLGLEPVLSSLARTSSLTHASSRFEKLMKGRESSKGGSPATSADQHPLEQNAALARYMRAASLFH